METLFWLAAAFILYVYGGYPLLLGVWAEVAARRRQRPAPAGVAATELPGVSVIIAARNEGHRLPARIENLLASDYQGPMQIIVASDGSTDATEDALEPYAGRINLITLPPSGKAAALNAAVIMARHPILVFADARQRFSADAIRHLTSHFGDPAIGAVSGELVLEADPSSTVSESLGAYWSYEKWLRRREAIVGSTLGVTGAIYAMRRSLWQPMPWDTLLDDVLAPMRVVLSGYRVAFDARAHAYDGMTKDTAAETRRKVRTLAGNFQLMAREPRLLVPVVNPVWLQFMSHKIGRLLVPYALLAVLFASAVLARESVWYAIALAVQVAFYGLAGYGAVLEQRRHGSVVTSGEVFREAA
jgi:biofilm PGA synthesis N-glycosyltransferase PgaC